METTGSHLQQSVEQQKANVEFDDWPDSCSTEQPEADVPELPAFLDDLEVSQITPDIERCLSLNLDLAPIGLTAKNYEWLAFHLGMPWPEVKYLKERVQHPLSPTSEVLWRYRKYNLGNLLRIIRDDLQRYDVILQLKPYFSDLQRTVERGKSVDSESVDSGVSSIDKSRLQNNDIVSLRVSRDAIVTFRSNQSESCLNGTENLVFVTSYGLDCDQLKSLAWLCKNLVGYGAHVIRDDQLGTKASVDLDEYLMTCYKVARNIIVVGSAKYKACVEAPARAATGLHEQVVRFIYKLMCSEYRDAGCRNYRFRPVVFDGTRIEEVASFLKNTIIYSWPKQHEELMEVIFSESS